MPFEPVQPGADPPPYEQIGAYKLGRLLGRGGTGAVYFATRVDGEYQGDVAIKLIDRSLPSASMRERFAQERQILARLNHPAIVRLFDGGVTARGDLYIVMEHIDGVPIHDYCRIHNLSMVDRISLFRQVCDAIQYAHQNLVVHRDLKPENILVTKDGAAHVLDFETAQLLSQRAALPEDDPGTPSAINYTPQYASPEQVLGTAVTAASDTYALGVVLYLILVGRHPYELPGHSVAELVEVICVRNPRPTASPGGGLPAIDADLDAILMKSLRKESAMRYVTAQLFSDDLRAYLEHRPVDARRGTLYYRAGKFFKRHRLAVGTAVLVLASLVVGVIGVLRQTRIANQQRESALARSSDLRKLSNSLLSEIDEAFKDLAGSTAAQRLLVTRVVQHLDHLSADSGGDRQTQLDLIDAYTRLANVQGNGYEQNLADSTSALVSIDKALALALPLVDASPTDREALKALAVAQDSRGEILMETGHPTQAAASLRAASQTYDRLILIVGETPDLLMDAASVSSLLGDNVGEETGLADIPNALIAYHKALQLDQRAHKADPGFLRAQKGIANIWLHIGNADLDTDPLHALADYENALQGYDHLPESELKRLESTRGRTLALRKTGVAHCELGDYTEASALLEQTVRLFQQYALADSKNTRAQGDLKRVLDDDAFCLETDANPALSPANPNRLANLIRAGQILEREAAVIGEMIEVDTVHAELKTDLSAVRLRLDKVRRELDQPPINLNRSNADLDLLARYAASTNASSRQLELAVEAELGIAAPEPSNIALAVAWAERGVEITHHKTAEWMMLLARAYRASGQLDKSRAAAAEGLELLAPQLDDSPRPRIRKLLEIETK